MSLNLEEELELERLLLMMEHWDKLANPPMPALQPPAPAETKQKPKIIAEAPEAPQDFINRICGPGSDRPSGRAREKHDWML